MEAKVEAAYEMGITLARSWFENTRAHLKLFTVGYATTENLPMKLEHGRRRWSGDSLGFIPPPN